MHIQTLGTRRHLVGFRSLATRLGARTLRLNNLSRLWGCFDPNKPEVMRAKDLPDQLRRDLGLPQRYQAPPTVRQMLELRLY